MSIAVIGAGMIGFVAAYRLASAVHECDLHEQWPGLRAGGDAGRDRDPSVPGHPRGFFTQ